MYLQCQGFAAVSERISILYSHPFGHACRLVFIIEVLKRVVLLRVIRCIYTQFGGSHAALRAAEKEQLKPAHHLRRDTLCTGVLGRQISFFGCPVVVVHANRNTRMTCFKRGNKEATNQSLRSRTYTNCARVTERSTWSLALAAARRTCLHANLRVPAGRLLLLTERYGESTWWHYMRNMAE